MDDDNKSALDGIFNQVGTGGHGFGRAAAAAYLGTWEVKKRKVIEPAFKKFGDYLATQHNVPSYVDDSGGLYLLTPIDDPGMRFVFADKPMFPGDADGSFFEIQCLSAEQSLQVVFELHEGDHVEKGSVEGMTLHDLDEAWIVQQLTMVLAKTLGQEPPIVKPHADVVPDKAAPAPDAPSSADGDGQAGAAGPSADSAQPPDQNAPPASGAEPAHDAAPAPDATPASDAAPVADTAAASDPSPAANGADEVVSLSLQDQNPSIAQAQDNGAPQADAASDQPSTSQPPERPA